MSVRPEPMSAGPQPMPLGPDQCQSDPIGVSQSPTDACWTPTDVRRIRPTSLDPNRRRLNVNGCLFSGTGRHGCHDLFSGRTPLAGSMPPPPQRALTQCSAGGKWACRAGLVLHARHNCHPDSSPNQNEGPWFSTHFRPWVCVPAPCYA